MSTREDSRRTEKKSEKSETTPECSYTNNSIETNRRRQEKRVKGTRRGRDGRQRVEGLAKDEKKDNRRAKTGGRMKRWYTDRYEDERRHRRVAES